MWNTKLISTILKTKAPKNNHSIGKFSFDTRNLEKNDCFIALKGERDGHDFIKEAHNLSCITIGQKNTDFIVEDSIEALTKIGIFARDNSPAKKIAITGSAGKTTTKFFLYQILSTLFKTIVSEKSFNNHIGVPITLTKLSKDTDFGIFELGTNNPGEIQKLSKLVQPDVAIITNISGAHIGQFPDGMLGIFREKTSIVSGMKDGTLIAPRDSEYFDEIKKIYPHIISFGKHEKSDICLLEIGPKIKIKIDEEIIEYQVPFSEEHHILNTLPIWAIFNLFDIPYQKVIPLFQNLIIPEGRGKKTKITIPPSKTITIIDDAYNAPFEGFKASLQHLSTFKKLRKVAILGDMGELGDYKDEYHQKIIKLAKDLGIEVIVPFGPTFAQILKKNIATYEDIIKIFKDGDIILLKGSNTSGLQSIVKNLLQYK